MSACSAPVSGLGSAREQQGPESCSRSQGVGALTRLSGGRVVREGHARHTNLPGPPGPGILSPLVPSARLKPLPILTTVSPHQEPETTRVTSSSCQHPAVLPRRLGPTPPASQDPPQSCSSPWSLRPSWPPRDSAVTHLPLFPLDHLLAAPLPASRHSADSASFPHLLTSAHTPQTTHTKF